MIYTPTESKIVDNFLYGLCLYTNASAPQREREEILVLLTVHVD